MEESSSFDLFCFDTGTKYANYDHLLAVISIHPKCQFPVDFSWCLVHFFSSFWNHIFLLRAQNSELIGYLSFEKNIISRPVLTPTQTSHPCQQNNYFCVFHATALIEITFWHSLFRLKEAENICEGQKREKIPSQTWDIKDTHLPQVLCAPIEFCLPQGSCILMCFSHLLICLIDITACTTTNRNLSYPE